MIALRPLVIPSLIAVVAITPPAYSWAEVIYQSDFEQPGFMPGLLPGQDQWQTLWGSDAAMISSFQPRSGAQSVQIDGAALRAAGGFLVGTEPAWPLNYDPVVNNFPIINIRVDVRLDGPGTHPDDLISANLTARTVGQGSIAAILLSSSEEVWWGPSFREPVEAGTYNNLGLRLDFAERETEFLLNGNFLGVVPFPSRFPEPELTTVGLELAALNDRAVIDPGEYTAYFDNLIITVGDDFPPPFGVLLPGDANQDLSFDQLDLIQVAQAGKFLTGEPATWGEGDWDNAPGGEQGSPPPGDGVFDQLDIISALGGGVYLTGSYAALMPNGWENDGQASIVYVADSGEVRVDPSAGMELTSINIDSAAGIFTGEVAQSRPGSFENDADSNIFKATFGSSFGSLRLENVAQAGLTEESLLGDLSVVGSLAGGGDLGNVDLVYVPEPASVLLLSVGMVIALVRCYSVKSETR